MASLSSNDVGGTMRVPVTVSCSADTINEMDDPQENEDVEGKMDHEVERVLREWDTNKQRITHNSIRLRPTALSSSTPNSPFQQRRKRVSNSLSNLSLKDGSSSQSHRKHFEFPEINVMRREDSRLNSSADFEVLNDDTTKSLFIHCPSSGQKLFKMEFDTEGYPHDSISVRVSGNKLVIHAQQNETVDGRVSTTEFCRKVKLPKEVNAQRIDCHVSRDTGMLVVTAPVLRSSSSSTSSLSPKSPALQKNEALNTPFVRTTDVGKTLYLNADVGRIFHSDDVTVKVIGQNKLLIMAKREENTNENKLDATVMREFALPEKIIPKTIQAGLTTDGILKIAAVVEHADYHISNGNIHIEHMPGDIKSTEKEKPT